MKTFEYLLEDALKTHYKEWGNEAKCLYLSKKLYEELNEALKEKNSEQLYTLMRFQTRYKAKPIPPVITIYGVGIYIDQDSDDNIIKVVGESINKMTPVTFFSLKEGKDGQQVVEMIHKDYDFYHDVTK